MRNPTAWHGSVQSTQTFSTLPETNSKSPENGWLEYDCFLLGPGLFSGTKMLASGLQNSNLQSEFQPVFTTSLRIWRILDLRGNATEVQTSARLRNCLNPFDGWRFQKFDTWYIIIYLDMISWSCHDHDNKYWLVWQVWGGPLAYLGEINTIILQWPAKLFSSRLF